LTRGESGDRSEQAWNEVASRYEAYFTPRFAPYLGAAIGALAARGADLPRGAIVVPCVGPGRELSPLSRLFPERAILASDLSGEMVKLAAASAAHLPNVTVTQGDATELGAASGGTAAIVSVFGLQLLPSPAETLELWLGTLQPKGLATIVYWPRDCEEAGPFQRMRAVLREAGIVDGTWGRELSAHIVAAGAHIALDAPLAFEIHHDDAETAWSALTQLGPLRALALARGEALVAELGARFTSGLAPGPIVHTPEARLLVIERDRSPAI
jgi:trans-aconitate methyltransferase